MFRACVLATITLIWHHCVGGAYIWNELQYIVKVFHVIADKATADTTFGALIDKKGPNV